jgi:peptide/nickel transport system substrate-binding protein
LIFFSEKFAHFFNLNKTSIGMIGAYSADDLPQDILTTMSEGLTKVSETGEIQPAAAVSWEVKDKGKTYVFHLRKDLSFDDGKPVTSETISYPFADVKTLRPDKETIIFQLKDAYAPFLVTVSQPIFRDGLKGIGEYKLSAIKLNGSFVSSLTLASTKDRAKETSYIFYPNEEALKTAFLLGETTEITGINDLTYNGQKLLNKGNVSANKVTDYSQLVTIFYDTKDSYLSDNKLRKALTYALPSTFFQGQRTYVPYPQNSIYYDSDIGDKQQDMAHAKALLDAAASTASTSAFPQFTLTTQSKYKAVADTVVAAWKKLGVRAKVVTVDTVPDSFQMYLGDFHLPKDPDQYTLWHSNQRNNITKFQNLRIDKLLEDGRKTVDVTERKKIYSDFQKYLLDDSPATFLYFPYSYTVTRK